MPRQEVYHLHPRGWETDPEDEYFPLSTLDYLAAQMWCNYALFFKLPPAVDHAKLVSTLKRGLEVTLSQVRQLAGVLTKDPRGSGLCFHRQRANTVEFHVQWLDDDASSSSSYPSFEDLERQHFVAKAMGDPETWCVPGFQGGERPAALHTSLPKAAAYKLSFVRGGAVLMAHHHHFSGDIMAWSAQTRQLAENCAAIWAAEAAGNGTEPEFPPWDPACLDLSCVTAPEVAPENQVDGPSSPPQRHPALRPGQRLLFHLSRSKTAELKRRATPPPPADGSRSSRWISSYDACMAHVWRVLSRHKARLYGADMGEKIMWGEAVNMRRRFTDPAVPWRIQGNLVFAAISDRSALPQFTAGEVISKAELWELAWYVRQLTNTITPEYLAAVLSSIAPVRDKTTLFCRTDSFHPLGNLCTDWRDAAPCDEGVDFGFARPYAFRWPFDTLMANMWVVYPRRVGAGAPAGEDEGWELSLPVEKEIVPALLADPEWSDVFEFRGLEMDEEGGKVMTVEDVGCVEKQATVEMEKAIVVDPVAM